VIYTGLNAYAINSLEFRANGETQPEITFMQIKSELEICNPTFFPASYNRIYLDMMQQRNTIGSVTVYRANIVPYSTAIVDAQLDINPLQALAAVFKQDFDQLKIRATLDAPIFVCIPFSPTKDYSMEEFSNLLAGGRFSCQSGSIIPTNLAEVESKMNAIQDSLEDAIIEAQKRIESTEGTLESALRP